MIVRHQPTANFTTVNNAVFESGLPLETVGLLIYLLSKPESWRIRVNQLQNHWKCGRQKVYRMLSELQEAGYAQFRQGRADGGTFEQSEWVIFDAPCDENWTTAPVDGFHHPVPRAENPQAENHHALVKTESLAKTEGKTKRTVKTEEVWAVFDFWRQTLEHPKAKLGSKRRQKIQARLKDGYSVADLQQAITGCSYSAFHMGDNPDGKRYDDIELICRDEKHVEQFMNTTPQRFNQRTRRNLEAGRRFIENGERGSNGIFQSNGSGGGTLLS